METKSITTNRKAYYEYEILEKWEAGISLTGTEVKSIRDGRINLSDGWVEITDSVEATLRQVHISPYSHGNIYNHDPLRPRKLLLKKSELKKLLAAVGEKGLTVVPLSVYLKGQRVKIERSGRLKEISSGRLKNARFSNASRPYRQIRYRSLAYQSRTD